MAIAWETLRSWGRLQGSVRRTRSCLSAVVAAVIDRRYSLHRLDLNVSELDGARTILQPDRTTCVGGVLNINCFCSVQHHDHVRTLCGNLEVVPLSSRLHRG